MKTLVFFLFLSSLAYGQIVQGVVLDVNTNKPIQEAHVFTAKGDQGTTTNYRGKFRLKLPVTITLDSIYVSHIGYKQKAVPFHSKKNKYIIFLEPDRNQLKEVQLSVVNENLNTQLRYNKLTSMKTGRHSFGSYLKDDKIYVIGGDVSFKEDPRMKMIEMNHEWGLGDLINAGSRPYFNRDFYRGDVLIYDLKLDYWELADLKFRKRAHHNIHLHNNTLYVLGGKRLSKGRKYEYLDDKIEIFDQISKTIQVDDTNPHQAVDFASFTYDDKLIIMGGSTKQKDNGQKEYTNKVHLFDLKTGLWYDMASMPIAKESSGVRIGDTIYLIGGTNERPLSSIEAFDLITGQWKKAGELFESFSKPAVTAHNNVIYAFEDSQIIKYNTTTNELSQYRINLDLKGSQLHYANNKLYILGGFRENSFSKIPSPHLYSIDVNEFDTTKAVMSKSL